MASPLTFVVWAESLETMSYYDILRVPSDARPEEIQKSFHDLSLRCHPDRFIDEPPEVGKAAEAVFKRLVEAYNILRRPQMRARYDAELQKGQGQGQPAGQKFDEHAVQQKKTFEQRTLFMIARTPRAKQFAAKADRFLSAGQLDEARVALITACQDDHGNEELNERLQMIYEALSFEPGDF